MEDSYASREHQRRCVLAALAMDSPDIARARTALYIDVIKEVSGLFSGIKVKNKGPRLMVGPVRATVGFLSDGLPPPEELLVFVGLDGIFYAAIPEAYAKSPYAYEISPDIIHAPGLAKLANKVKAAGREARLRLSR